MGNRTLPLILTGLLTFGPLLIAARHDFPVAQCASDPRNNLAGKMPFDFDRESERVVADLDRIEADTLSQMEHTTVDRQGQVRTLGKLLLFDKHPSVNQNEACSFCQTPETGFTGPIEWGRTAVCMSLLRRRRPGHELSDGAY